MPGQENVSIFFALAFNFTLARLVGVVAHSINRKSFTVTKSKFWQFTSLIIAGTFIVCYPIALCDIFAKRKVQVSGIWLITEIIQYTTTYLLTAYIYVVNIFYSGETAEYINHGFHYCFVYERRLEPTANERGPFLYQFVFRTIYSYAGFMYSNYIRLAHIYGRHTELFTMIYYLPDIVIASAAIRFMITIMIQLTFTRRLNEILQSCMETVIAVSTDNQRGRYERERISCELSDRIDWLCDHHIRLQDIARATERLLSTILILSTVYAFANLVSCVSEREA